MGATRTEAPFSVAERRWLEAADRACGYYRRNIREIINHTSDDNHELALTKIRVHAEEAIRAADGALDAAAYDDRGGAMLRAVALALVDGGVDGETAEAIPSAVWGGLHDEGLIELASGFPGGDLEPHITAKGRAAMLDAVRAAHAGVESGS